MEQLAGCVLALASLLAGCATAPAPTPERSTEHAEAAYLISPLRGYQRSVNATEAERLRRAHEALVKHSDSAGSRGVATELLDASPDLHPASVLLAQSAFVDGDFARALESAGAVASVHAEYLAAQLLVGRAAEKLDRITEAFKAYSTIAPRSGLAERRAATLRDRAVEISANRAQDLIARGRWEEAAGEVGQLETWAPEQKRTLEIIARFAAGTKDAGRELEAVRRLAGSNPSGELRRRMALLELDVGDAGAGMRILEELVAESPGDANLVANLDRAKFRWRLGLLPEDVVELLDRPELARAEHAKLLFWLFPDVRYGRPGEGRIASDILDHPHRHEIARVVNLGLMRVDSTLHLFYPDRPLTRREALQSILRILDSRRARPACFGDSDPRARLSTQTLCLLSARCGLLAEPADCLPEAGASGQFVEGVGFAALNISGGQ